MHAIQGDFAPRLELPLSSRLQGLAPAEESGAPSFPQFLAQGVGQVNAMQQDANAAVHELLTGGDVNQAEVFTAVQKADMAFRLLIQVRNKLLAAYEEINAIRV